MLTSVQGTAVYVPEKEALVWKIRNFPGGKEYMLRCKFGLPSVAAEEEATGRMPPIRVAYEIPYFTVSGIQVTVITSCYWVCLPLETWSEACFNFVTSLYRSFDSALSPDAL